MRRGVLSRLRLFPRREPDPARERFQGGLLSFVVPVYNVEEYLDECLTSLREQKYRDCEIVVVNDGTPDNSMEIARAHASEDPRIRLVERQNGGLSAARNTGVSAARGEFLAFVDSDDTVPAGGYRSAVRSLGRTGSDFAVLAYQRRRGRVLTPMAAWVRAAHRVARHATTVQEHPEIQVNAIACSKVFRREFWERTGLRFREGVIYEDQEVASRAYALAESIDVLPEVLYHWRVREDYSSISQAKETTKNLSAQFDAAEVSLEVLRQLSTKTVREERARQLLTNDLPHFLKTAPEAESGYLELAEARLPALMAELPEERYRRWVPAQHKVLYHLICTGQTDAVVEFLRGGGMRLSQWRVGREPVGPVAYLPTWSRADVDVPEATHLLAESQTKLRAHIVDAHVMELTTLRLSAWVFPENVDLSDVSQRVRAFAVRDDDSEERRELPCRQFRDERIAELHLAGVSAFCDSTDGAYDVQVDLTSLPPGAWAIEFEVSGLISGSVRLTRTWQPGTASVPMVSSPAPGRHVRAGRQDAQFLVRVTDDCTMLHTGSLHGNTARLEGSGPMPPTVCLQTPEGAVEAVPTGDTDAWSAEVVLPTAAGFPWTVTTSREGRVGALRCAPLVSRPSELHLQEASDGVRVIGHENAEVVRTVHEDGSIGLDLRAEGMDLSGWQVVFRSPSSSWSCALEPRDDGCYVARLPEVSDLWDAGPHALPSGVFEIRLVDPSTDKALAPSLHPDLRASLPNDSTSEFLRVRFEMGRKGDKGHLAVEVMPPLAPEERGTCNQAELQLIANSGTATEPAVFFRPGSGAANLDACAIHDELLARGSELIHYWSVADHSTRPPDGCTPLLEGSRAWHEKLGAARFLVVHDHQPDWYQKPAGQILLRATHEYPSEAVGLDAWLRAGLPQAKMRSLLSRSRDWDYLISPAPFATPVLRQAFFEEGDLGATSIIETGLPRNDVLVARNEHRSSRRAAARARLGLEPDHTAVLWVSMSGAAPGVDRPGEGSVSATDLAALSEQLGDRFVILWFGTASVSPGSATPLGEKVRNVGLHPDLNALFLAADVGVFDRSPLRFDFALTRKPMIFFAPEGTEAHDPRPLLPDQTTSPGPHAGSRSELAAQLADLPGVRARYAPQVEEFITAHMGLADGGAAERVVDAVFHLDQDEWAPPATPGVDATSRP